MPSKRHNSGQHSHRTKRIKENRNKQRTNEAVDRRLLRRNARIRMSVTRSNYNRWTPEDVKCIIEFMRENPFEAMCSQKFFKRLQKEKKLELEWKVIRAKICNMRASYAKAAQWLKNTVENGEETKSILLKICPYYYELDEILNKKPFEIQFKTERENISILPEHNNVNNMEGVTQVFCMDFMRHDDTPSEIRVVNEALLSSSDLVKTNLAEVENLSRDELRLDETCNADSYRDYIIKEKQLLLQEERLNFEKRVKVRELELRERDVLNQKLEIEIKRLEIESKERLAFMEMELKEKIAFKELQIKYGVK